MINLFTEYKKPLVDGFYHDSYVANKASQAYTFTGNHEIVLTSMIAVDPVESWPNAPRTGGNRFGTVTDVEDETQTLTLTHHTKWTKSIDGSDNSQQAYLKRAGDYMALMMREKINPLRDKYTLKKWAQGAGKVVTSSSALSASNIVGLLIDAEVALANAGVPVENRFCYTGYSNWKYLRMASEWVGADNITDKMILKGYMGNFNTLKMVFVPDSYMPSGVYAIVAHKDSVLAPLTWKTARVLETAQGFDGPVMEYHDMWDAFVIGKKSAGVYALVSSSNVPGDLTITKGSGTVSGKKATISAASGSPTIHYTIDGTDPKYSDTAKVYTAAIDNLPVDTLVRACAEKFDASTPLYWGTEASLVLSA